MFRAQVTPAMELLSVACVCLLAWSHVTSAQSAGACPEPFVSILDQTKDWALLQCEVLCPPPKPKLEWQDSSGNTLPSEDVQDPEGRGKTIIHTTVTKTDRYRCIGTHEEHGRGESETFVFFSGSPDAPGHPTEAVVAAAVVPIAILLCVVVGLGLYCCYQKKGKQGATPVPQSD